MMASTKRFRWVLMLLRLLMFASATESSQGSMEWAFALPYARLVAHASSSSHHAAPPTIAQKYGAGEFLQKDEGQSHTATASTQGTQLVAAADSAPGAARSVLQQPIPQAGAAGNAFPQYPMAYIQQAQPKSLLQQQLALQQAQQSQLTLTQPTLAQPTLQRTQSQPTQQQALPRVVQVQQTLPTLQLVPQVQSAQQVQQQVQSAQQASTAYTFATANAQVQAQQLHGQQALAQAQAGSQTSAGSHAGKSQIVAARTTGQQTQQMSPRARLVATFSIAFVVKALCILSNVLFQVSPLPQVQEFEQKGNTGMTDAAPLMSILYCGWQWCFYGSFAFYITQKSGFLMLVYSNASGALLGLYYVFKFNRYCMDPQSIGQLHLYLRAAVAMASIQIIALNVLSNSSALFFCGLLSSISSVIGAMSLCATLPRVIRTQCSASINVELLTVSFASSVLWVICGVMLSDFWIATPNFMGLTIQTICFFFVMFFPREYHEGHTNSPVCRWLSPSEPVGTQPQEGEESEVHKRHRPPLFGKAAAAAAMVRAAMATAEHERLADNTTGDKMEKHCYGSTAMASNYNNNEHAGTGGTGGTW